ncbi:hypothetical protein ACERZ8_01670 [Tateyamaria armeniaca]|uniref:Uncharacterized protein n=1 Tax=Tateyamaria armeniaca TaxID=2518930 RepID=A0ABW8UNE3_9RHOB
MPLHILLIMVIGGIAGIALALHLLGLSRQSPFTEGTARAAWLRHRPDDTVLTVDLTNDGLAARILSDKGRGILWHMGADTCARLLTGGEEAHVRRNTVTLHLNDYTAPKIRLHLTPDEQESWANWITER